MAVPVGPALAGSFLSYDQIKKSFICPSFNYMYVFQLPFAASIAGAGGLAFIDRLWLDWLPGRRQ